MRQQSLHGQMLAVAGAVGLLGSLWLPWYTARFPQSAWQTFTTTPAVLLVSGVLVAMLSLLELSGRTGDTSRLAMLAGGVATILVGYRIATPPAGVLHAFWGAYLALASALTILGGGLLTTDAGSLPEVAIPPVGLGQAPARGFAPPPAP
ncbi:MAG: hypothetical protein JO244_10540 [Solirubrobacterales bacterium]|nr:hypothetical protein [Solirubrobacterales bacterium]